MSLLDKLWDDIVAGPQPEKGLNKLRKYSSFSARSSVQDDRQVSRSITIIKPSSPRNISVDSGSTPSSPASSGSPTTLFSSTPRGDLKKSRRKSVYADSERAEPRSPTEYDWVVISGLDR